jgi:uncharacterized membrane protein YqjE
MADSDVRNRSDKSAAELVADLSRQLTTLIHEEIELAKVELSEKGKRAGVGAGLFGGAGLIAILGLASLTGCVIAALQLAMPLWLAALIVGVAYEAVAGVFFLLGKRSVEQALPPVPKQAVESTKEDVEWLKSQARSASR